MNSQTVKALVQMIVIIVVNVAAAYGISIDADALTNVICAVILIAATAFGVWKNCNFTEAAQKGQKLIDEIKSGKDAE